MSKDSVEIESLKRRFETHLEDYRVNVSRELDKNLRQDELHRQNMEAIAALTKSTQDVVDAWVFANTFQKFIKWASGFALIAVFINWLQQQINW
jgi:hypothetical protein